MIALVFVTVLLGGIPVPASRPARIQDAEVVVPVDPFIRRIARLVTIDPLSGTIVIGNDEREVRLRIIPRAVAGDGTLYVRLAPIVRALGGSVTFDAVRKVVAIEMPAALPVTTPTPFDPSNPTVSPRRVFTPEPTTTPRPTLSGIPQPRRTPVPAVPSFP